MECRSLDEGEEKCVPSVITTQMVKGAFLLTDVRAHGGGGHEAVFAVGVLFSLNKKVRSQKHQVILSKSVFAFRQLTSFRKDESVFLRNPSIETAVLPPRCGRRCVISHAA